MLTFYSQAEHAHRDTLIRKAEGVALDALAAFWSCPRLTVFSQADWRAFLAAVAWAPRGTLGMLFDAVEALYAASTPSIPISLDPAAPASITRTDGDVWDCSAVGRLIRLRYIPASAQDTFQSERFPEDELTTISRVFYSVGPGLFGGANTTTLELAPHASGYWEGARWDFGPLAVSGVTAATAQVLRFLPIEDSPGPLEVNGERVGASRGSHCLIELLTEASLFTVPATYLLEPGGVDRDAVDLLMPDQGHIMDEFNLDDLAPPPPANGDQVQGPRPIYLPSTQTAPGLARVLDLFLAAGVRLTETSYDWCP